MRLTLNRYGELKEINIKLYYYVKHTLSAKRVNKLYSRIELRYKNNTTTGKENGKETK